MFIYLFITPLGLCCSGLSFVVIGGYALLWYTGFSLQWLLLLQSTGSRACMLQYLQLLGSRAQAK